MCTTYLSAFAKQLPTGNNFKNFKNANTCGSTHLVSTHRLIEPIARVLFPYRYERQLSLLSLPETFSKNKDEDTAGDIQRLLERCLGIMKDVLRSEVKNLAFELLTKRSFSFFNFYRNLVQTVEIEYRETRVPMLLH